MESLPNEIHQLIFKHLRDNSSLLECVLVSKNWKRIYQPLLYTNVQLSTFSHLINFLNTVEHNQLLNNYVLKLSFLFDENLRTQREFSTIARLLSLLPNLEYIDFSYYAILVNALLSNELPRLSYVKPPTEDEDSSDYAVSAIVLKDRIQNLTIANKEEDEDTELCSIQYYRLFSRLHEFKHMQELCIKKKTLNVIEIIEHVIQNCPSLRNLCIDASRSRDDNNDIVLRSLPILNISQLSLCQDVFYNSQIIHYIVSNFLMLKVLNIFGDSELDTVLDEVTFNKLIEYLTHLRYAKVKGINCNKKFIMDSIGNFWESLSQSRIVSVEIYNSRSRVSQNLCKMSFNMTDRFSKSCIMFPSDIHKLQHAALLENYGPLIDSLTITNIYMITDKQIDTSFDTLILHSLIHCTKLKGLSIIRSTLKTSKVFNDSELSRVKLDYLRLEDCRILENMMFKRLSYLIYHIKSVKLLGMEPLNRPIDTSTMINRIDMSETNIGTITISKNPAPFDNEKTLLLSHVSTKRFSKYYHYDFTTMNDQVFKPVNVSYYRNHCNSRNAFVIDIRCNSAQNIKVSHLDQSISVKLL